MRQLFYKIEKTKINRDKIILKIKINITKTA